MKWNKIKLFAGAALGVLISLAVPALAADNSIYVQQSGDNSIVTITQGIQIQLVSAKLVLETLLILACKHQLWKAQQAVTALHTPLMVITVMLA